MKKEIAMVMQFHKTFKCFTRNEPSSIVSKDIKKVRMTMLKEEVKELEEAMNKNDLIEIADAICDILYIVFGTAIVYGLWKILPKMFAEVHRSNMSKADENGNPILRADGKILKGPNFSLPNLGKIIWKP